MTKEEARAWFDRVIGVHVDKAIADEEVEALIVLAGENYSRGYRDGRQFAEARMKGIHGSADSGSTDGG